MSGFLLLLVILSFFSIPIWRTVRLPTGLPPGPACARCRYDVTGVDSWRCPECGADLKKVGVATPFLVASYRGNLAGAFMSWALIMIVLGQVGWSAIREAMWTGGTPMQRGMRTTFVLTPRDESPAATLLVESLDPAFRNGLPPDHGMLVVVTVQPTPNGRSYEFTVDRVANEVRWTNGSGTPVTRREAFEPGQMAEWLRTLNEDWAGSGVATDLSGLMQSVLSRGDGSGVYLYRTTLKAYFINTSSGTSFSRPITQGFLQRSAGPLYFLSMLGVFIVGIVVIRALRARILRLQGNSAA